MKFRPVFVVFFAGVIAGFILITATLTGAQSTPGAVATGTPTPGKSTLLVADAFVRGGPGDSYVPVGAVSPQIALLPVSRNAAGDWVLIRYNRGFGWLRRDLAYWTVSIDNLPVISTDNLTPSPIPGSQTATPFFPTETPTGDYIRVSAQSAYVRAGPGRTYLRLGQLYGGDPVAPVGRDETTAWIMIHFGDGFGWIRQDLAVWVSDLTTLPVLTPDNLTPSATFTATSTFTPTNTLTVTPSPTLTFTPSNTFTSTPTVTASPTLTDTPTSTPTDTFTATETPSHTATWTATPTATLTSSATETLTGTPTLTLTLTETLTSTLEPPTATLAASDTPTLQATDTAQPSAIPTLTARLTASLTATLTATATPTVITATLAPPTLTEAPLLSAGTATEAVTVTVLPSLTNTLPPTITASPTATVTTPPSATASSTATPIEQSTATATLTVTLTATQAAVLPMASVTITPEKIIETETVQATVVIPVTATAPVTETMTATATVTETPAAGGIIPGGATATPVEGSISPQTTPGFSIPAEAVLGGLVLLAVIGYIVLYLRGAAASERYAKGFVIDQCPVCQRGELLVDSTTKRTFGIPRIRHIVRCSNCRSVLREVGYRRWRYAVDRLENIPLYDRLNNREVDEDTLRLLLENPVSSKTPVTPPDFIEGDRH